MLVIDALQYRTHPSHFSLGEALEWIERLKPGRAVLTHMHMPLDYATVMAETPDRTSSRPMMAWFWKFHFESI